MAEFVSLMKKNFRERKKMMRWSITLSLFLAEKKKQMKIWQLIQFSFFLPLPKLNIIADVTLHCVHQEL